MITPEQPLLECHFCKKQLDPIFHWMGPNDGVAVWCIHCDASGSKCSDEEAALINWNIRHQPTDQEIDQAAVAYSKDFSDWDDTRGAAYSGFEAGVKWALGLPK